MNEIRELNPELINKIAAGEVIEAAHSVVKEVIENSLDSGATHIEIETQNAGLTKILIGDNGSGISETDLPLAIKRHATSKIQEFRDLESVLSFGFRGEALASIAAVSKFKISTGKDENSPSCEIEVENGEILSKSYSAGRKGTLIEIRDLFYNTPVRRKFLKSERSEDKKIRDRITTLAIPHFEKEFHYTQNSKKIFSLKPAGLKERIVDIFGENLGNHLMEVKLERRGIRASGYISSGDFYRSNRNGQFLFINNRSVEIKFSSFLLKKCYDELLPSGAHPWCFLFFQIDPRYIDVNVHPTKKEIRFLDEEGFQGFFMELILSTLRSQTPVTFLEMKRKLSQPQPQLYKKEETHKIPEYQDILHNVLFDSPSIQKGFSLEGIGPGSSLDSLTENSDSTRREFIPRKHFGILFETYILAEAEDGLYIIDQHTAHERIRYEEVLNQFKKQEGASQILLAPIRLDFSLQEAEDILEFQKDFHSIGLQIEDIGGGSLVLREVPVYIDAGTERETILDFLSRIHDQKKSSSSINLYDLMAKSIACRSAVKKGDHISDHLLGELLTRLSYCKNPSRCPHGRPTLIKFSKFDLEKLFHRR